MKKNSKISYIKNNITSLNILIIALYGVSFLISKNMNFDFSLNLVGFIYLLFITPLNISIILNFKFKNIIEYLLISVTVFFTIITPLYFVANSLFQVAFTFKIIAYLNLIISIIIIFLYYKRPENLALRYYNKITWLSLNGFAVKYWPLLSIISLYFLLHLLNYHFYVFMPEWDGYSKLTETKNAIRFNDLETTYRGFFTVAIILISKFSKIPPYIIFTSWFIILQTTLILVLYRFLKIFKVRNKAHQFIILLTVLAIPVLNIEIDITRPQSVFVVLLPIHIYFLFKAIKSNNFSYWILSTLIVVAGLNYHEFFVFTLLLQVITVFIVVSKKYFFHTHNRKDRFIFQLLIIIMVLLGIIFMDYFSFLNYFTVVLNNIFHKVTQTNEWRWWFLSNYSTDGSDQQLGWPGVSGALKYYSYYASPAVLFVFFLTLYLKIKRGVFIKTPLLYLIMPLVILLLIYSELLPRLNYTYLPERVWLMIDILLILLLPVITIKIQSVCKKENFRFYLSMLVIFSIIGISGTLYVTKNKKALTSTNEYHASQWIKNNTSKNSIFITQIANKPMVEYFANRKMMPISPMIFESSNNSFDIGNNIISPQEKIAREIKSFQIKIHGLSIDNMDDINNIIAISKSTKKLVTTLQKSNILNNDIGKKSTDLPIYVLYSNDKFNGIYAQREWWLKANYHGAKIENLTKKYPLVYNKNGIYIWKIK